MRLEDLGQKVAVVTGAASGIGRATALGLAAAGARVFVADIDDAGGPKTCAVIEERGGGADFIHLDVSDEASIEAAATEVLGRGQPPAIVVNAAGWDRFELFLDNSLEFMDRIVRLNLLGPVKLKRAFLDRKSVV